MPSTEPPRKAGEGLSAVGPGSGMVSTLPLTLVSSSGDFGSFGFWCTCCTAPWCQAESYSAKTLAVSNRVSWSDSSLVWLAAVEYLETRSDHCCRPATDFASSRLPFHLPSEPLTANEPPWP